MTEEKKTDASERPLDCVVGLRTFEVSDALGDGDFSLLHRAADEIEDAYAAACFYVRDEAATPRQAMSRQSLEIERLRNALGVIWDKYLTGGSQYEPTTSLAGTLAYIAKRALDEPTPNAALTGAATEAGNSPDANPRPV